MRAAFTPRLWPTSTPLFDGGGGRGRRATTTSELEAWGLEIALVAVVVVAVGLGEQMVVGVWGRACHHHLLLSGRSESQRVSCALTRQLDDEDSFTHQSGGGRMGRRLRLRMRSV